MRSEPAVYRSFTATLSTGCSLRRRSSRGFPSYRTIPSSTPTRSSAYGRGLSPLLQLRDRGGEALFLVLGRHGQRLLVVLARALRVAGLLEPLGETVPDVPRLRMVRRVLAEEVEGLGGLAVSEKLVPEVVHVRLGRERHRLGPQRGGGLRVALLLEERGFRS